MRGFKARMDPRNYNGAVLLGLDGVVVKSHGGTDAKGFSNALKYAIAMVSGNFSAKIRAEIERASP
jgi:glycerol-3-phosphate acyltransferase PlsX